MRGTRLAGSARKEHTARTSRMDMRMTSSGRRGPGRPVLRVIVGLGSTARLPRTPLPPPWLTMRWAKGDGPGRRQLEACRLSAFPDWHPRPMSTAPPCPGSPGHRASLRLRARVAARLAARASVGPWRPPGTPAMRAKAWLARAGLGLAVPARTFTPALSKGSAGAIAATRRRPLPRGGTRMCRAIIWRNHGQSHADFSPASCRRYSARSVSPARPCREGQSWPGCRPRARRR